MDATWFFSATFRFFFRRPKLTTPSTSIFYFLLFRTVTSVTHCSDTRKCCGSSSFSSSLPSDGRSYLKAKVTNFITMSIFESFDPFSIALGLGVGMLISQLLLPKPKVKSTGRPKNMSTYYYYLTLCILSLVQRVILTFFCFLYL